MVTKNAQNLNFARPAVRLGIGLVALLLVRFIVNRLPMLEGSMAIDGFVLSYSSIGSALIDTLIILLILSFGTDIGRQLGVLYPRFRQLSQITTLVTTLVVLLIAYNSYGSVGSALLRDQGIYDLIFLLITAVALIALLYISYRNMDQLTDLVMGRFEAAVKSRKCPECGAAIKGHSKFCIECGHPLSSVKKS